MSGRKELGNNGSKGVEDALAKELTRVRAEKLAAEIRADVAAAEVSVEKHGSFAAVAREHDRKDRDDPV